MTLRGQPGQPGTWPRPGLWWFLVWARARARAVVLRGTHPGGPNVWSWRPGGKAALADRWGGLADTWLSEGAPQLPGSGKGNWALRLPPPRPLQAPLGCQCATALPAQPTHPSPGSQSLPSAPSSLCASTGPPSSPWPAMGEGLHLGAPRRTPLSELQRSAFPNPLSACWAPSTASQGGGSAGGLGHCSWGLATHWKQPCFP